MAAWRVTDVSVVAGEPAVPRWRVSELSVVTTLPAAPRWRVAGIEVVTTSAPALEPFATRTEDAFSTVTISARPTGDTPPDTYVWRVVSGGAVALVGAGATRTFRTPGVKDGTTLVLGVVASAGGVAGPEARLSIVVRPHAAFRVAPDGSLVAIPFPDARA